MTINFEKIKNMTVEEMAKLLNCSFCVYSTDNIPCPSCPLDSLCKLIENKINYEKIKQWLKKESEEQ